MKDGQECDEMALVIVMHCNHCNHCFVDLNHCDDDVEVV